MKGLLLTVVVWVLISPGVQGETVPTVPTVRDIITRPEVTVPRVPNITPPSITNRRVTPPPYVTIPKQSTTTDVVRISEIYVTTRPTIKIPKITVPSSSVNRPVVGRPAVSTNSIISLPQVTRPNISITQPSVNVPSTTRLQSGVRFNNGNLVSPEPPLPTGEGTFTFTNLD
ncbi:hypothetical protein [Anabaenopsis elenkinii]|uniref:Uncharacterized protein n=1 Tax=Anabaenopsis elenkinii CCIBt3563 TaxID=2779889 RepID=A0A7S6RDX1_9CYAN|nr:hypothetical protein [Anabaenopsis elenkinii]QOV23154.1 hypothetical protein IM676_02040 [Anabaenopsis elenkinii CCIBt3563]